MERAGLSIIEASDQMIKENADLDPHRAASHAAPDDDVACAIQASGRVSRSEVLVDVDQAQQEFAEFYEASKDACLRAVMRLW